MLQLFRSLYEICLPVCHCNVLYEEPMWDSLLNSSQNNKHPHVQSSLNWHFTSGHFIRQLLFHWPSQCHTAHLHMSTNHNIMFDRLQQLFDIGRTTLALMNSFLHGHTKQVFYNATSFWHAAVAVFVVYGAEYWHKSHKLTVLQCTM